MRAFLIFLMSILCLFREGFGADMPVNNNVLTLELHILNTTLASPERDSSETIPLIFEIKNSSNKDLYISNYNMGNPRLIFGDTELPCGGGVDVMSNLSNANMKLVKAHGSIFILVNAFLSNVSGTIKLWADYESGEERSYSNLISGTYKISFDYKFPQDDAQQKVIREQFAKSNIFIGEMQSNTVTFSIK
jgi:hypothetical protein